MTWQLKWNNVGKKRLDSMLKNERLLFNISWNKKPFLVKRQFKNVFLSVAAITQKTQLLLFQKCMCTKCIPDENKMRPNATRIRDSLLIMEETFLTRPHKPIRKALSDRDTSCSLLQRISTSWLESIVMQYSNCAVVKPERSGCSFKFCIKKIKGKMRIAFSNVLFLQTRVTLSNRAISTSNVSVLMSSLINMPGA